MTDDRQSDRERDLATRRTCLYLASLLVGRGHDNLRRACLKMADDIARRRGLTEETTTTKL